VDCPRGASRAGLNRATLKMEKRKGAVKIRELGICIREDEVRWFPMEVMRWCWKFGHSTLTLNLLPMDQTVVLGQRP
jgi:hypothetical protein